MVLFKQKLIKTGGYLKQFRGDITSFSAGVLFPFAFAPFEFRFLSWVSLMILFGGWLQVTPGRAFIRGWLWGIGAFLTGVSWVFHSMHHYGGSSVFAAVLFTFLFAAYLALYPALAGFFWNRFFGNNDGFVIKGLAAGLCWASTEWLRSWVLTGFPWLMFGYSHMDTPFEGFLPFGGDLFVSALAASSLALILFSFKAGRAWIGIMIVAAIAVTGFSLNQIDWQDTGPKKTIDITLIQGNIPQELKLKLEHLDKSLKTYYQLSLPHLDSDLVIWPETAMPTYRYKIDSYLQKVAADLDGRRASILTGIFLQTEAKNGYYNALLEIGGDWQTYTKQHLVPFGEYMPVRWLMELFSFFIDIPKSDMSPAPLKQKPLVIAGITAASNICYEMAFPDVFRNQLKESGLIINVSNDSWFGDSFAASQNLEIARVRAKEFARPVARVTNDGVTAFIDKDGRLLKKADRFKALALRHTLTVNNTITPFCRMGQFVTGGSLLCIFLFLTGLRKKH